MANYKTTQTVWERLQHSKSRWQRQVLPGLIVIALVVFARTLGLLQELEWATLDSFLRWHPAEQPDDRVLIVGIDEADIQQVGAYPIPDQELAALLQVLAQHAPRAIAVDMIRDLPVEPGHGILAETLATSLNIFGIEKIAAEAVSPPRALPPGRIGFTDFPLDSDGFVRRAYLGAFPFIEHSDSDRFRFSLALQLAKAYLAEEGLVLENGLQNPENMRFGDTELWRVQSNSGGYVNTDATGVQVLIHPRSGKSPFKGVSMADVLEGRVDADLIRDRLVLIGVTSLSAKDLVNSAAVNASNPGRVYGVAMHAHITSQILSAVLDDRPMLRGWRDGWEYLWIVLWGGVGMLLVRYVPRPSWYMLSVGLIGLGLVGTGLALLWLGGWWVPVMPALMVFVVNGWVLPGFYFYDQTLRSRIDEHQRVIEHTYDAIHNGPLQTLALLLQQQEDLNPPISAKLDSLNQELRAIYQRLLQESLPLEEQLQLGSQEVVDLRNPLYEVLHEVYTKTLKRDFPGFDSIQFQIVKFEPMQVAGLSSDDRRSLCRFLEEALCNVGKHAVGAKRLTVLCLATESENLIRVEDNGRGDRVPSDAKTGGRGTQQALALAKRLHGTFQRSSPGMGIRCELRWPVSATNPWRR